jgi:hypothetical protein
MVKLIENDANVAVEIDHLVELLHPFLKPFQNVSSQIEAATVGTMPS